MQRNLQTRDLHGLTDRILGLLRESINEASGTSTQLLSVDLDGDTGNEMAQIFSEQQLRTPASSNLEYQGDAPLSVTSNTSPYPQPQQPLNTSLSYSSSPVGHQWSDNPSPFNEPGPSPNVATQVSFAPTGPHQDPFSGPPLFTGFDPDVTSWDVFPPAW
jgi:hypothetical protein